MDDIDSPNHPHGQHAWTVNNAKFEIVNGVLKLKAGESLDYEDWPGRYGRVTATDMNGETDANNVPLGLSTYPQDITITVNDKNDAPEAADSIGNWWVVVPEDLTPTTRPRASG